MDTQQANLPVTSNVTPPNQPVSQISAKPRLILPILAAVVATALIFGAGGYYLGKMSQESPKNEPAVQPEQQAVSAPPTALPSSPTLQPTTTSGINQTPEAGWQSHIDPKGVYKVNYPTGWRTVTFDAGEGFGPAEMREDVLWIISSSDKASNPIDEIAEKIGSQFSDRKQEKQEITINGRPATKYITTTGQFEGWYLETIVIDHGNDYFVLANGAINDENLQKTRGVAPGTTFEKFYSSFQFVE
jgi:cytoskeletal protein RodZ